MDAQQHAFDLVGATAASNMLRSVSARLKDMLEALADLVS